MAALRQSGLAADLPAVVLAAGRVQVATASARACGIRAGMRRRDAVSRCPEVAVLASDPDRDARIFEPVAAAAEEVAPGIEVLRPGLIACSARGPARYFGSENAAAERIVDAVEAFHVECRVGIAGGLLTAILAARQSTIVPAPTAAPTAGAAATEATVTQAATIEAATTAATVQAAITEGSAAAALDPDAAFCARLPIAELARDPAIAPPRWGELIDLLYRLGITTAGAFAALPLQRVATRFGADGVTLHRLASGRAERDLSRRHIEADIAVEDHFDPPLDRVDTAAFAARALALRFHTRLAAAGLACTRLDITATTEHGDTLNRTWRCVRPLDAAGTADRLRWQLDGWLTRLARADVTVRAGAITMLRLDAALAVDAGRIQYGLWGADGFSEHRAGSVFARVQGLLGTSAVIAPLKSGGRGPADRISLAAWGEMGEPDRDPDGAWPGALPTPAPARAALLPTQRRAPAVSVTSAAPAVRMAPMAPAAPAARATPVAPAATAASSRNPITRAAPWLGGTAMLEGTQDTPMLEGTQLEVCDQAGYHVDVTDRGMLTGAPAVVGGRRVLFWAGPWLLDECWWFAAAGTGPAAGTVAATLAESAQRRRARMQVAIESGPPILLELGADGWSVEAVYD